MTGVNKLSSCIAAFLSCGSAIAAAPIYEGFDAWSVTGGTTTTTDSSICPEGFTCATAVTGDGFYQRQIIDDSGEGDYFQTIITDKSTSEAEPLTFADESYVETGKVSGLADKTTMVESTSTLPLTDEFSSADHIKAVRVGQDMASISDVAQEFGFTAYEDFTSGTTNTFSLIGDTIDTACYSTPTGTDSSSGFIPAPYYSSYDSYNSFSSVSLTTPPTDFTPPTVIAPTDISTVVSGHANFFNLDPANGGLLPEVTDNVTESFDFSASNNVVVGPLPPGRHSITWQAKDNAGNEASAEQQIDILPTVNFEIDQVVTENSFDTVTVTAYLNGPAPEYPVLIPYTVSGTATSGELPSFVFSIVDLPADHDAVDGVITIESGTTGQTSFSVIHDDYLEGDETVVFTMDSPTNAVTGHNTQHTVTISENPQQLTLDFVIIQDDRITPLVTTENGVFKVTAIPVNEYSWPFPSFDWSQSNSSLVSADCSQGSFYVDPSNLSPGLYRIHVTATAPSLTDQPSSAEWWLRVGTAPPLSDSDDSDGDGINDSNEGYQDDDIDGIPNYLDVVNASYLIPGYDKGSYKSLQGKTLYNEYEPLDGQVGWSVSGAQAQINYPMLIATEPGQRLGAGSVHLWNYEHTQNVAIDWDKFSQFGAAFGIEPGFTVQFDEQGVPILYDEVAEQDKLTSLIDPAFDPEDPVQNDGKHFMVSLEISHLAQAGGTALLVIPQAVATDAIEGYSHTVRSYTPAFGWQNLLEDHNNQISSALREGDFCPPPGASNYQSGLIEGFECLQLTLEDGGANDADGYRNGRIDFHGGVLPVMTNDVTAPETAELITEPEPEIKTDNQAQTGPQDDDQAAATPGGGGGAVSLLFMTMLVLLRRRR